MATLSTVPTNFETVTKVLVSDGLARMTDVILMYSNTVSVINEA